LERRALAKIEVFVLTIGVGMLCVVLYTFVYFL